MVFFGRFIKRAVIGRRCEFFPVAKFCAAILADMEVRGLAISLVTLARVELSSSRLPLLRNML